MQEYKIIEGTPTDCQKWLNQWRHEFEIEILSQNAWEFNDGGTTKTWVVITLTREKKNAQ